MSSSDVNTGRRRFLVGAVTALGGIGGVFAAVPFVVSWSPSERARAIGAPVEVNLDKIEPGARITVKWRGKPVYVVKRTDAALEALGKLDESVRDPNSDQPQQPAYAKNQHRSRKPDLLVIEAVCTHLSCAPIYRPEIAPVDLGESWLGGFYCPCHGSRFDLAGRVYSGVPAPTNLVVPPYTYLSDNRILIGEDGEAA